MDNKSPQKQNPFVLAAVTAEELRKQAALKQLQLANFGIVMKTKEMRVVSKYAPHQGNRERIRRMKQLKNRG